MSSFKKSRFFSLVKWWYLCYWVLAFFFIALVMDRPKYVLILFRSTVSISADKFLCLKNFFYCFSNTSFFAGVNGNFSAFLLPTLTARRAKLLYPHIAWDIIVINLEGLYSLKASVYARLEINICPPMGTWSVMSFCSSSVWFPRSRRSRSRRSRSRRSRSRCCRSCCSCFCCSRSTSSRSFCALSCSFRLRCSSINSRSRSRH